MTALEDQVAFRMKIGKPFQVEILDDGRVVVTWKGTNDYWTIKAFYTVEGDWIGNEYIEPVTIK